MVTYKDISSHLTHKDATEYYIEGTFKVNANI